MDSLQTDSRRVKNIEVSLRLSLSEIQSSGDSFIKRASLRFDHTLKSTPALIFIKTVFDVKKLLASRQGLSRRTLYCRFFKCKLFLQLAVLNYDDW